MKQTLLFLIVFFLGITTLQAQTYDVLFKVNMSVKSAEGIFDPVADDVFLAGNFTDWGTGAVEMTDANTDLIYEYNFSGFEADSALFFKFIFGPSASGGTWEDMDNREYTVPAMNSVYEAYFENDSIISITTDGTILFYVDMTVMQEVGNFDYNTGDSVQIRGAFNGWSGDDKPRSHMEQDFLDPNVWSLNVTFTATEVGAIQEYKFYVNLDDPGIWTDGWERPASRGGGNRQIPFEGTTSQVAPYYYYDDIEPYMVIETGKNLTGKFTVDMTSAMDPNIQGPNYFVPGTDTVYWVSEQPSFQVTQGWTEEGRLRVLPMTQVGTSNIYEGTLPVQEPSFNTFVYRYAYAHFDGSAYSLIYEDAGFGAFAYRTRYMGMTAPREFTNQNHVFPQDDWIKEGIKPQEMEPLSVRGIDGAIAQSFDLSQNYPNPFNPSTMIKFSVPEAGLVTLKIYNILGQEVATLINRELLGGVYEVDFNASSLSSGIYFYTLSNGDFNLTKKMMLMK